MTNTIVDAAEEWRPVHGWEGLYSVSSMGRVFSIRSKRLRKTSIRNGYYGVDLCREGRETAISIHRLMVEAFIRPLAKGEEVNHKNGIRLDNRLSNLEICTSSENHLHACRVLKRINSNAKLTPQDVADIRAMIARNIKTKEIASRFNVRYATIFHIKTGRNWFSH